MQRLREAGTAHILRRLRNFTRFTCQGQTEKETLRLKRVYAVVAPVVFGNWRDGQQPPASSFLHGTHRDNPPITMATAAHAAAARVFRFWNTSRPTAPPVFPEPVATDDADAATGDADADAEGCCEELVLVPVVVGLGTSERETGLLVLMGTVPGGVVLNRLPSSVTLPEQALT